MVLQLNPVLSRATDIAEARSLMVHLAVGLALETPIAKRSQFSARSLCWHTPSAQDTDVEGDCSASAKPSLVFVDVPSGAAVGKNS
jgi:hypothetical protein